MQITGRLAGGAAEKLSLELTPSTNAALRLVWARDRIAASVDAGNHSAAIALAKEFNLLCEGVAFIAWDEAEKVAIAGQEIYQPNLEHRIYAAGSVGIKLCTTKFLRCSPLDSDELDINECAIFDVAEDYICRSPRDLLSRSTCTPLSEATDFFTCHLPNLRSKRDAARQRPVPPAKPGQSLEDWISAMLRRRGAPNEFIQKFVAWLDQEFGSLDLEFPIRDWAFIAWVLQSAKSKTDNATVSRQAKELVDRRPGSGGPTLADFALWTQTGLKQKLKHWFR